MIDTRLNAKRHSVSTAAATEMIAPTAPRLTVNGSANGASEIKFKDIRFLITDRPTEATLDRFIEVSATVFVLLGYSDNTCSSSQLYSTLKRKPGFFPPAFRNGF